MGSYLSNKSIRFFKCLTIFLILIAFWNLKTAESSPYTAPAPSYATIGTNFTYDDFQNLIEKHNPQTVEEAISLLPADLRKQAVLMKNSDSLQRTFNPSCDSSPTAMPLPRVLLVGSQGFVISFNDENQPGGKALEMAHLDKDDKWQFVEYIPGQKPHVNPTVCKGCHGVQLRPIWDGYPCWKGAYGEDDDKLKKEEKELLGCFFKRYKNHPRYKLLEGLESRYDVKSHDRLPLQTNARFLDFLNSYNDPLILRKIKESPDYEKFKFAIAAAFLGCRLEETSTDPQKSFFPMSVTSQMKQTTGDFIKANRELYKVQEKYRFCGIRNGNDVRSIFYPEQELASLDYIFLNRGLRIRDWFTSFNRTDPTFLNQGRSNPVSYALRLAEGDPELKAALGTAKKENCRDLQTKSYRALK